MGSSQSVNHGRSRRRTPVKDKRRAARLRLPASTRSNRDKSDNIYRHTNAVKGSEASPESVTLTLECDLFLGRAGCPSHLQLAVAERSPPASARSGHRKGGAPLLELSPFREGQPTRRRPLLPLQRLQIRGNPLYLFSLSLSHHDVPASLQSSSVCSVISQPPMRSSSPACSSPRFLIAGLTGSKWR